MIKNIIIVTMLIVIWILLIIMKKNKKDNIIKIKTDQSIDKLIENLREKISTQKLINTICNKTIVNYKNTINFLFNNEEFNNCKKYIHIENNKYGEGIVIIFYEDSIKHYNRIKLKCIAFGDGAILNPLIDLNIDFESDILKIQDINCYTHTGCGIGTCIINALTELLPTYNIKQINAGLSDKDYAVREKLYKFYRDYNKFKIVKEIKEDEWGLAVKRL